MAEGTGNEKNVTWTVFSCSQNLPAILNDPKRGKQKDFFTRTWGDSFVETAVIPRSTKLEDIPNSHFLPYCRKLRKRHRKLEQKVSSQPVDPLNPFFPSFFFRESSREFLKPETSSIPRIFFTQNFAISNSETFREVFEVDTRTLPSKMIQDKLSHYLDLVEVGLAQQISKKSSSFFSAVSSQDKVAEKVSQAFLCVRQIKELLTQAKRDYVEAPQRIISMARQKSNLILVLQKLQLMATVHQAQQAVQSLLGNADYVGALDLIATTQEVLKQELQGLVSFRHLDSQLVEIRNAIEKTLRYELEWNLASDLNRPIDQIPIFFAKDHLVSIMLGHLRLGKIAPIVTVLAKEISTAMTATCKQTLIEAVSESDAKSDSLIGSTDIQLAIPQLSSDLWLRMIEQLSQRLVILLRHIRDIILLFQECGDSAIGHSVDIDSATQETLAAAEKETEEPEPLVSIKLHADLSTQLEKTALTADEKFTGILRARRTWVHRSEYVTTLLIVRQFIVELEEFLRTLSRVPKTFRYTSAAEMKTQTNDYFQDFHKRQVESVNIALDREKWKPASDDKVSRVWPITNILRLIEGVEVAYVQGNTPLVTDTDVNANTETTDNKLSKELPNSALPSVVEENISPLQEPIRTAEVFFVILYIVAEYCYLVNITGNAEVMLGLVDLLRGANVRLAHLVLGGGAVELKTIKKIAVSNLAVVMRGLSLLSSTLPEILEIFKEKLPGNLLKHIETVRSEMIRHSGELESKMLSIIVQVNDTDLSAWDAKAPVPSNAVNAVSRNLKKFKEVIDPVLTQKQISDLFLSIDKAFRLKLKERIGLLGILKDGGPRQAVVVSEMMHYAENLRNLNVLPANVISSGGLTQELWSTHPTTNNAKSLE